VHITGSRLGGLHIICYVYVLYRGIVVVIDSLNFQTEIHDLAELLYDLFSDYALHKARAPVLLACNKQDIALARNVTTIRQELEKEM